MPSPRLSPVGAHVPVSAGLAPGALRYAASVQAEAIQVFLGNPRGWALPDGDPARDERFRTAAEKAGLATFVHAPYLVNLGSPTAVTRTRSAKAIRHAVSRGRRIGARGVVMHTGSAVDGDKYDAAMASVREAMLPILDGLGDEDPDVLLEPTAGQGQSLCAGVDDLDSYLDGLERHPRLGVCLDTCHAFAAGHDLASPGGLRRTLDRLVRVAGKGRLRLVHANDSKDPLGSHRDRHERIGRGRIGRPAFAELFRHPAVRGVPIVLETPGKEVEHAEDIAVLRSLRNDS